MDLTGEQLPLSSFFTAARPARRTRSSKAASASANAAAAQVKENAAPRKRKISDMFAGSATAGRGRRGGSGEGSTTATAKKAIAAGARPTKKATVKVTTPVVQQPRASSSRSVPHSGLSRTAAGGSRKEAVSLPTPLASSPIRPAKRRRHTVTRSSSRSPSPPTDAAAGLPRLPPPPQTLGARAAAASALGDPFAASPSAFQLPTPASLRRLPAASGPPGPGSVSYLGYGHSSPLDGSLQPHLPPSGSQLIHWPNVPPPPTSYGFPTAASYTGALDGAFLHAPWDAVSQTSVPSSSYGGWLDPAPPMFLEGLLRTPVRNRPTSFNEKYRSRVGVPVGGSDQSASVGARRSREALSGSHVPSSQLGEAPDSITSRADDGRPARESLREMQLARKERRRISLGIIKRMQQEEKERDAPKPVELSRKEQRRISLGVIKRMTQEKKERDALLAKTGQTASLEPSGDDVVPSSQVCERGGVKTVGPSASNSAVPSSQAHERPFDPSVLDSQRTSLALRIPSSQTQEILGRAVLPEHEESGPPADRIGPHDDGFEPCESQDVDGNPEDEDCVPSSQSQGEDDMGGIEAHDLSGMRRFDELQQGIESVAPRPNIRPIAATSQLSGSMVSTSQSHIEREMRIHSEMDAPSAVMANVAPSSSTDARKRQVVSTPRRRRRHSAAESESMDVRTSPVGHGDLSPLPSSSLANFTQSTFNMYTSPARVSSSLDDVPSGNAARQGTLPSPLKAFRDMFERPASSQEYGGGYRTKRFPRFEARLTELHGHASNCTWMNSAAPDCIGMWISMQFDALVVCGSHPQICSRMHSCHSTAILCT